MLRGLRNDISGSVACVHMRTDANNPVTTASTTHVPEQQEIIHMIQTLLKEACSGTIADLSHVRTERCLPDCLTKASANCKNLVDSVEISRKLILTLLSGPSWNTRLFHLHG